MTISGLTPGDLARIQNLAASASASIADASNIADGGGLLHQAARHLTNAGERLGSAKGMIPNTVENAAIHGVFTSVSDLIGTAHTAASKGAENASAAIHDAASAIGHLSTELKPPMSLGKASLIGGLAGAALLTGIWAVTAGPLSSRH